MEGSSAVSQCTARTEKLKYAVLTQKNKLATVSRLIVYYREVSHMYCFPTTPSRYTCRCTEVPTLYHHKLNDIMNLQGMPFASIEELTLFCLLEVLERFFKVWVWGCSKYHGGQLLLIPGHRGHFVTPATIIIIPTCNWNHGYTVSEVSTLCSLLLV